MSVSTLINGLKQVFAKKDDLVDLNKRLYGKMDTQNPVASGTFSMNRAKGLVGEYSHAEGYCGSASGEASHAEGQNTDASGEVSHAEGNYTTASGEVSHAEGNYTAACGEYSHAEGARTLASGSSSHAEGDNAFASGICSHAEGSGTEADGHSSHAEGNYTTASGEVSHAEGSYTTAYANYQHVEGRFNYTKSSDRRDDLVHITGYGSSYSDTKRKNVFAVSTSGDVLAFGNFYASSDAKSRGGNKLATEAWVTEMLDGMEEVIPEQASANNQLADKSFVNSSIGTNTAYYINNNGQPFESVAALEAYSGTVTNNDYAFVTGTDSVGNAYFDRYKASVDGSTVTWAKEYRLNNSSFTAVQWAAIESGITAELVTVLSNLSVETWTFTLDDDTTVSKQVIIYEP